MVSTDFLMRPSGNRKGLAAIGDNSPSPQMRFRLAQKALGMRQAAMADALGVTVQSVSDIERGRNQLSMRVLTMLVVDHNISAYWLLMGEGPVLRDCNPARMEGHLS